MPLPTRLRRHAWLIGAFIIAAIAATSVFHAIGRKRAEIDPARQAREDLARARAIKLVNWRFREVCPVGHEAELVIGQTHLYVDMQAVGLLEIEDAQEVPDGCPTVPIFVRSVSFDHILGSKAQEALFQRHDLPLNHLDLDRWLPERRVTPELDPAHIVQNPDGRITVDGLGAIEDITHQSKLSSASTRAYRLQPHPKSDAAPPATFLLCQQRDDAMYLCDAYYLYGDMRVVGSSRVDLQACKLEYSIVSPK